MIARFCFVREEPLEFTWKPGVADAVRKVLDGKERMPAARFHHCSFVQILRPFSTRIQLVFETDGRAALSIFCAS